MIQAGRTYRNTDLWMQSMTAPYGLVGVGDELVGLDCTAQDAQQGHYATFAPELILPLVQQSVSAYGACSACGAAWKRATADTPVLKDRQSGRPWVAGHAL